MIDDVKISHKIAAMMIALGTICVCVALYAGVQLKKTSAQYAVLTQHKGPALIALAGAERANYQMAYSAAMVIVYPGGSAAGRAWARSVTSSFDEGLGYLAEAKRETTERQAEIGDLERRLRTNKVNLDRAVELALFNRLDEAALALTAADPELIAFGDTTRRLADRGVREHREISERLAAGSAQTRWILLAASIAGVILTVFAALRMAARTIVKPLAILRDRMESLAAGDDDSAIQGQERGDEIGEMARAVQVFRNNAIELRTSERKRGDLKEAKMRAEAANQAKRQFLAHMTHELRTPLNGVLTMAHLMAAGHLDPDQKEKLEIIRNSGQDLLNIINNILDFSKIEAGKLELEQVDFDADALLEDARRRFALLAEHRSLRFSLEIDESARGRRRGDPIRLRQIVSNYVSNALKFTERGEVAISIHGLGEAGQEGLRISVRDTGLGIPDDKMALLFQSFTQIDSSTTRQFDGTGLGLVICRELAGLMNGRVWAESVFGDGATFYAEVMLPRVNDFAGTDAPNAVASAMNYSGPAVRILAAEDNATNQEVLRRIMDAFDLELHLVNNGRKAVEAWGLGRFDLILMDIQMPEMDGLDATRAIRSAEAARGLPRTPILALTANAFVHQIHEYVAAGMDGHIAKPIEVPLLLAAIEGVLSAATETSANARIDHPLASSPSGSGRIS